MPRPDAEPHPRTMGWDTVIGLLGDVMLGRGVAAELMLEPCEEVWDPELRALGAKLDLVVCNLECCISARGRPTSRIPGKPFFFRGPPPAVGALQALGVRAVCLANNHALDFGPQALADTLASLGGAGIATAGAGRGLAAARRAAIVPAGDTRVGLVAVTDHPAEYGAGPGRWGVAYADLRAGLPAWLQREITAVRERCDTVIAFPHWGPNMATRPASWQRELATALQSAVACARAVCWSAVLWRRAGRPTPSPFWHEARLWQILRGRCRRSPRPPTWGTLRAAPSRPQTGATWTR